MLAVLIRNPAAFLRARDVLFSEHVVDLGEGHALVWEAVRDFYGKFGKLPAKEQLNAELHQLLQSNTALLANEEKAAVDTFVRYAFSVKQHGADISTSESHVEHAMETCQLLLEEHAAKSLRAAMLQNGTVPADMRVQLDAVQATISLAASLTESGISEVFPDGWEATADVELVPTNFSAIDNFLGGGGGPGEVTVFMGPQGSCKSTLAVQIAANLARVAFTRHTMNLVPDGKRPVSVLVTTEMELVEFRLRVLAYLAKIPQQRLRKVLAGKSLDGFSRDSQPGMRKSTKYERRVKEFREMLKTGKGFTCEYDRIKIASALVNQYMVFVNATPSNETNPGLGSGGVPEIVAVLSAYLRKNPDVVPINFVLDHASALASRMIGTDGVGTEDLRHILKNIPLHVRDMIAARYKIPAYVMHQLSGDAASRGPTAEFHHTDAAECKSFTEFAAFAIISGPPTQDGTQLARFRCTKHRRQPPVGSAIVQINGAFNEVVDCSDQYTVDTASRTIVLTSDLQSFASGRKAVKASSSSNKALPTEY